MDFTSDIESMFSSAKDNYYAKTWGEFEKRAKERGEKIGQIHWKKQGYGSQKRLLLLFGEQVRDKIILYFTPDGHKTAWNFYVSEYFCADSPVKQLHTI